MSGKPRKRVSARSIEGARAFLSALFMGARTAQIHDPSNAAFGKAVDNVFETAIALHGVTNGFSIKFVEDAVYLDGARLRFEASAFATMRSLRNILEAEGLGGIEMASRPTRPAIEKLLLLFSKTVSRKRAVSKKDVIAAQIGIVGVQRLADGSEGYTVDRRVFAVQSYGKLILALREQFERAVGMQEVDWATSTAPPRLRVVRVIQDFVELANDRVDFVLRLQDNKSGAALDELYGVNSCLLTIALGAALGMARQTLVDMAVGTLFHHVGCFLMRRAGNEELAAASAVSSLARLLQESGLGRSTSIRGIVVAECLDVGLDEGGAHICSRIARVATKYQQMLLGYGGIRKQSALGAMARLRNDPTCDSKIVDLLFNVLAAYPEGTEVVLGSGRGARVVTQAGGSRWDRPIVRVDDESENLDLMSMEGDRFVDRITHTKQFVGRKLSADTLDDVMPPLMLSDAALLEIDTEGLEDLVAALEDPDFDDDDDRPPLTIADLGPSMLEGNDP